MLALDSLDDQSVKSGSLGDLWIRSVCEMFLLVFSSDWVLVTEDEVNLVGRSTLL